MELYTVFNNKYNNEEFIVKLYITLMFFNNNYYSIDIMKEEIESTKLILTKINNLKVKIQLKRKEKEINSLLDDIKNSVSSSKDKISNYIKDEDELMMAVNSLDPKKITEYIDKITKKEMNTLNDIESIYKNRCDIINILENNEYSFENGKIVLKDKKIELDDFYDQFSYLLNINNYEDIYKSSNNNSARKNIVEKIIDSIKNNSYDNDNIIIPVGLTCLIHEFGTKEINTSDFEIENIKISDLYTLANKKCLDKNTSKWKNINIPNEYLLDKIKIIVNGGMYYYKDSKLVLELVKDKISDFKISIDIDKIKMLLKNTIHI